VFMLIIVRTSLVMAATKLTLKLEKSVIEKGKELARYRGLSLSKLIEQFLEAESKEIPPQNYIAVPPHPDVLSLVSDVSPTYSNAGSDKRDREEYYEYLYSKGNKTEEE